jgi:hypothetical protein
MIGSFLGIWVAATLTIAILSFLYKDNPFYRFAEHVYVGVSAAFTIVLFWNQDVWPLLVNGFVDFLHARNYVEAYILIIPAVLGLMMLTQFFPKAAWVSRWPLAMLFGIGAGLGITGSVHGSILPQLKATLLPLGNAPAGLTVGHGVIFITGLAVLLYGVAFKRIFHTRKVLAQMLSMLSAVVLYILLFLVFRIGFLRTALAAIAADNLVIVVAVIGTLLYFFFSREHKGIVGVGSRIGIAAIMISFGASFGYTVMARVSLLIGRCYFLINDWIIKGIIAPLKSIIH